MKKVVKSVTALLLAGAVAVTGVMLFPKSVSAKELSYAEVMKIALYDDMDSHKTNQLVADLKEKDYNSAARYLVSCLEDMNSRFGFDVDAAPVLKALRKKLKELGSSDVLQINSSGNLAALSKAYAVNTVADFLVEAAQQNGTVLPEVPEDLYEMVVKKSVGTEDVFASYNRFLEENNDLPDSDAQLEALDTIVLTLQYSVGTDAERIIKTRHKEQQLEKIRDLVEQQKSGAEEYDAEETPVIDQDYVEKFYAINQIQTYMDILYGGGAADDEGADESSAAESSRGYAKVHESYDEMKKDLAGTTGSSVEAGDAEIVVQMNDVQSSLAEYIAGTDDVKLPEDYSDISKDGTGRIYASVQTAYNNSLVPTTLNAGVTAYQLAMYAEELSGVRAGLNTVETSLKDVEGSVDGMEGSLGGVKNSLDITNEDIQALKSKYSVLSLRTASDLSRIYGDLTSLGDADINIQSNITSLTMKTKTDLNAMSVLSDKSDKEVLRQSEKGDAVLSERADVLESQLFTTVLNDINIAADDWAYDSAKGKHYFTVVDRCFTESCLVQIEYSDEPDLIPTYVQRDGRLIIYSEAGTPAVKIDAIVVFSDLQN